MRKAIRDFALIQEGDRIAVAVSGGKDSLGLLHLLREVQGCLKEQYSLHPLYVVPAADAPCEGGDAAGLARWIKERENLPLGLEPMEPAMGQPGRPGQSPCFHCAWRRRKALFLAADRLGCNKVALGHHADDVATTVLMNLFYHGKVEAMEPRLEFFEGHLTVIRPLFYVPEKELARLAKVLGFPPALAPCVAGVASQRAFMARVLREVEKTQPRAKANLWRAVCRHGR
ncbi:MAG: ATP-binding protein [Anaerolineae bacterium]